MKQRIAPAAPPKPYPLMTFQGCLATAVAIEKSLGQWNPLKEPSVHNVYGELCCVEDRDPQRAGLLGGLAGFRF